MTKRFSNGKINGCVPVCPFYGRLLFFCDVRAINGPQRKPSEEDYSQMQKKQHELHSKRIATHVP